ncbi:leucine zipper putative tumor suppressor 2 homolog isoform X2 [Atheta coriaria]|uniref:leucine zipper putative tumor suppressor 2 homolog isoform X2 n=1 Tax=Dalotia coriaria TaxID=877792 RepID=UPI0031F4073D
MHELRCFQGKVLIRPIAFKPSTASSLNSGSRFGLTGERYGSTPILTRPGSRLTLYGSSSDVRQSSINPGINNYSLDRKLRSSCQSMNASPSLAMSSLSSLPHKLITNYDSLESVRKSPLSTVDGSILNKTYNRLTSVGTGSLLDLTPSPSDSGVSELEAALRDRDSELAYLRQTMEHNEQVIFRVYQEKERTWERELRRFKGLHEQNIRTSSQRVFKLEQMLMMQNYQHQQEKKRLCAEAQRAGAQTDRLSQEVKILKDRLEETEWNLCQKTGEISLLKSQLKDIQNEHNSRGQEAIQARNECRQAQEDLTAAKQHIASLEAAMIQKDLDLEVLRAQLAGEEPERLRKEIDELREELSEVSMSEYEGLEAGRAPRTQRLQALDELRRELDQRQGDFEKERVVWAQEKEKVLRYQRQLQMNYVQMYRRTRSLEAEVESLSIELELDKSGMKTLRTNNELNQTIEL